MAILKARQLSAVLFMLFLVVAPIKVLCAVDDTLKAGARLITNQQLVSANGQYSLIIQADCNLVLYRLVDRKALWASGSSNKGKSCFLILHPDANLVVYNNQNLPVWSTGTARLQDSYKLIMQNDGNLVLYTGDNVSIWATMTVQ